jgi:hypothetical protein
MHTPRFTRITTLAVVAGVLAGAPAAAVAYPADMHASTAIAASEHQDLRSADAIDSAIRAEQQGTQDLRSPDTVDAAAGRGTFSAPDVVVVKVKDPQALPVADGLDWGDAGIGAGVIAGLALLTLGGTLVAAQRRQTRVAVH